MTEDQHKELWCPFTRLTNSIGATYNRDCSKKESDPINGYGGHANKCLGSRCAAWRWETAQGGQGFCGLAGEP